MGNATLRKAKSEIDRAGKTVTAGQTAVDRSKMVLEKAQTRAAKDAESKEARLRDLEREIETRQAEAEASAARAAKALDQVNTRKDKLEAMEARILDDRKEVEATLAKRREEIASSEAALKERAEAIEEEATKVRVLRDEVNARMAAASAQEKALRKLEDELERIVPGRCGAHCVRRPETTALKGSLMLVPAR